ncbi:lantibiotic dehydratase C-terminal domain-containing protein [Staphylococcus hominis]|uniref:lantibiotic dehydratase C-terminal domain-containing protein n=1 Tax=Staphylococcus hominis TaxID=1290 RepID=UPI000989CF8B
MILLVTSFINIFLNEEFKNNVKYFIRYIDDKKHIRLRIKINKDQINKAMNILKEMLDINYINTYKIVPYYIEKQPDMVGKN